MNTNPARRCGHFFNYRFSSHGNTVMVRYHTDGDNSADPRVASGFQISYESFGKSKKFFNKDNRQLGGAISSCLYFWEENVFSAPPPPPPPRCLNSNFYRRYGTVHFVFIDRTCTQRLNYFFFILCLDIDECYTAGCTQVCRNYPGSYSCSCRDGWFLSADGVTCFGMIGLHH